MVFKAARFDVNIAHGCVELRERPATWPEAATTPETEPGHRSSPTSTRKNSKASTRMPVSSLLLIAIAVTHRTRGTPKPSWELIKSCLLFFAKISSTCWTTMRRPRVSGRQSLRRRGWRTISSWMPSWRRMSWRCLLLVSWGIILWTSSAMFALTLPWCLM